MKADIFLNLKIKAYTFTFSNLFSLPAFFLINSEQFVVFLFFLME